MADLPPLDAVDAAFAVLCTDPAALAVDGSAIGHGIPPGTIRLDELRDLLLGPSVGRHTQEAAWKHLVRRAQNGEPAWVIGAAGVALPGLRNSARRLCATYGTDPCDVDATVLSGFVAALHSVDVEADYGSVVGRLQMAAFHAGEHACRADAAFRSRRAGLAEPAMPPRPAGHPDFVLAAAVRAGILTRDEAELIGRTRIEGWSLADAAEYFAISEDAAVKRRQRAEPRLVRAIRRGAIDSWGHEFVRSAEVDAY